ncbi:glutathione peroxidase [Flavobacterium pallidum]|uniref:Glutathione peroxidase n=1 Tax=Flavobacterium pallidum TaxID=2172098 RepID=A0A2S1SJI6_9FLAO|nr:glutathione peroxidase [Flavobacterium pallidum]AWI26555.1 glutathione peroxidase [Flavobacterium pallidum]
MKKITFLATCLLCFSTHFNFAQQTNISSQPMDDTPKAQPKKLHDFNARDIEDKQFNFSTLKGKKVMIVNTASECGFTPQYKELEELYQRYKDKNFVIIGFPSNDFGEQEPGTNKDIAAFCKKNYGVTFPMMAKVSVTGNNKNKVYQFLTEEKLNGLRNFEVKWNFQKFLIDENGNLIKVLESKVSPLDPAITSWIDPPADSAPKKE